MMNTSHCTLVGLDTGRRSGVRVAARSASRWLPAEFDMAPLTEVMDDDDASYEDWFASPAHRALIHGVLAKMADAGFRPPWKIVAGVKSNAGQPLRDRLAQIIRTAAGEDSFVGITTAAAGIYFAHAAAWPELRKPGVNCVVLDVGYGSTDLQLVADGRPLATYSQQPLPGTQLLVEDLANRLHGKVGETLSGTALERALSEGKVAGCDIDIAGDVAAARRQFARAITLAYRQFAMDVRGAVDYVLVGGGGAELVAGHLPVVPLEAPADARRLAARGFLVAAERLNQPSSSLHARHAPRR